MLGIHDLTLFVLSGLVLNMTPGPDSLLIASRSASNGWKAGMVTALGVSSGTLVHVGAAALGLSAVLATSAVAFGVVKWLGAIYLIWIGLTALCKRLGNDGSQATPPGPPAKLMTMFRQGFLTNVLNPKVALFFMAFMPQFIDSSASLQPLAFLLLGLVFDVVGTLWSAVLVTAVAFGGRHLRPSIRLRDILERSVGGLFVALGVKLALTRTPQ